MRLQDLIEALAAEVEAARPRLEGWLATLATGDAEAPAFGDALDDYAGQVQRMGEAGELAGFPGLQAVCAHVQNNVLALPMLATDERGPLIEFLRGWPPLVSFHLRNLADPTTAAGLVDHLVRAPFPLAEEEALKVMHMLGAMPLQVQGAGGDGTLARPVLARPEDVSLALPADADPLLLEGFVTEAPEQARQLVALARRLHGQGGDASDVVSAKRVAHTLKGSGAILGLRGLASLGHHFEDILEHFERAGAAVAPAVAETLLDAADCLEQMVASVAGTDDAPAQSQAVLQRVLDLANRIDRGEAVDQPLARADGAVPAPVAEAEPTDATAAANAAPAAALRVPVSRIDSLFRVSGEVSVNGAALEAQWRTLMDRAGELLAQNLRVQKRLFELETAVDVRALARSRGGEAGGFDPLELDRYSELQGVSRALAEEAADARAVAARLQEELAGFGAVQARQQRLARELQHLVIGTRMTPVGTLESRLQRNVRSTCQSTGKQARLLLEGADTLVDSDVLNRLAEPLLHLLRNAVDHGLEAPSARTAAGKDATGRIGLSFTRQGQQVVLRCQDDGAGLDLGAIRRRAIERGLLAEGQSPADDELMRLVLEPGFSTRAQVSAISGRGVGLDVVREWVAGLNGTITIASTPGQGTTFELRFAASLTTLHSLVVTAAGQRFALPSHRVEQALPRGAGRSEAVAGQVVFRHGARALPLVRLADAAGLPAAAKTDDEHDVVVLRHDHRLVALAVEQLVDSRELLVKAPGPYARHLRGVAGLSILGDGGVAVHLDLAQLLGARRERPQAATEAGTASPAPDATPGVLIVDDSLTMRNALVRLVQDAGFRAAAARDGLEAIATLRAFRPAVVLTDLEMPHMNGIEFTTHLRGRDDLREVPVVMLTSRSQDKHRRLAQDAGVSRYLTKPCHDGELLRTLQEAIAA